MALLDVYDPVSQNTPVVGTAPPSGITALLQDRNFLSLLSGIGAGLDPKGVGGAIGIPTRNAIAAQAAQERATKQAAAQNAQTKMVIEALNRHGGISSTDQPGINSISTNNKGGIKIDANPQSGDYSGSGLEQPTVQTTTPDAPTIPQIGPAGTLQNPPNTSRSSIESLLPFYLALLR